MRATGTGGIAAAFCVMVLLSALLPGAALGQSCTVPEDIRRLTIRLTSVAQTGLAAPRDRQRLSESLAPLSEQTVLRALQDEGLDQLVPSALALLGEAHRIADGGGPDRLPHLRRQLAEFERVAALPCNADGFALFQRIQELRQGGWRFTDDDGDGSGVAVDLRQDTQVRPTSLIGLLALVILGLYALDFAYRWIMALIYNRKMCRIPAALVCGKQTVSGLVLTLGRGGCRFQPDDMFAFDLMLANLRNARSVLAIHDADLPARVSTIHDDYADFRFEERLPLKRQRDLLARSTISPFYAKKARARSMPPAPETEGS